MALFPASIKSAFSRRQAKKAVSSRKLWKSHRPLLAETLEGRWMLDATIITDNNSYYPNSTNTLTGAAFNESETIAPPGGNPTYPPVGSTVNLQSGTIGIFYTDETAMTLGVTQATVKTAGGTQVFTGTVSPLSSSPDSVTNPLVGVGGGGASSSYKYVPPTAPFNTLPIQAGTDPSGRPLFPSLYVTDITGLDPNSVAAHSGDWQFGGTPQSPNAVFGTWTSATETIDETTSPPSFSFQKGAAPAKNGWNLGPGADPAPTSIQNQGYGAEAQWTLSSVVDQNGNHLLPGHSYRFYFIVHDGDQNKTGGDVGQAAFDLISPITPTVSTTAGGTVALHGGANLTDSATISGGNNPTGTVTFNLYSPTDTTYSNPVYTTTVPVNGNGVYTVNTAGSTSPGGFLPTVAGTYEWLASYSGDKNNQPAASAKGDEPENVVDASIAISPLNPVNEVNHQETFTITVTAVPAATGVPSFGTPTVTFPSGTPATVTAVSPPTITGDVATYTVTVNNPTAATFDVKASDTVTMGGVPVTRTTGDNVSHDSPDAIINFVDANITITPQAPVNEVNHAEIFTITVTALPAATGAPTFGMPTVSFPNGAPGTVSPVTLVGVNGDVATYNVFINSATAGAFTVQASDTVTMGGVAVTRTTGDANVGDSPSAVKNYVDANITISPLNPVNEVGHAETFTITVTASPANTGAPSFSLPTVTFPTGTPGTVGAVTLVGINGDVATYTLTINSAVAGTFEVKASDTVTMGGLAVTRTTGDGLSNDSTDAVKTYVTAGITITPPTPVNEVNHQETFTVTETASPGPGQVPTFGTPVITFPSGAPATVGAVSAPSVNGNTATFTVSIDNPTAGTFDVKAAATITIGGVDVMRSTGDGLPGDSPDAVKNYVNANISITPPTPVNEVNHAETFTITVTALPAATGAPTFALPTVAFPSGTPGTVGPVTLVGVNGDVATYNVSINNPTAGTFTVQASDTVTMGGVAVTRTTGDTNAGDSASAVKNYVDANITISPLNPVNEVGHAETFTITVTASPANTGAPSFSLPTVTFPTGTPGTVGAVTLVGINGDVATYTLTINSAIAGTFEVKASDTVTMGGLAVTRTTGDGLSNDSADAVKTYVTAGITITPPTPVNEVNHQETFTVTETASPGPGQVPTFGTPVISFPSGTPATVGAVSAPTVNGNTATFTVSINNPTAGTFDVKAAAIITIGGVDVMRSTGDGLPGDSPDAVKNYVDANITISPLAPVNQLNHAETFTITVTALPAGTGTPTFSLPVVTFPGLVPGTVGPVTPVSTVGNVATFTETINSSIAGKFEVKASDTVTMGGVAVTRTTGDGLSGDSADAIKTYISNNPTINTVPGGFIVLGSGRPLSDTATVSGGSNPTGTVTFYLFAPGVMPDATDSNAVYKEVAPLVGTSASTGTGTSTGSALPTVLGTYQWIAVYNGDANNQSVASALGDEPEVSVSPPAISTFEGGTLHLGSGGKLYDSAQLQGGMSPTGTITFYLFAPGVTPDNTDSNNIYKDVVNIDPKNPNGLYDVTMGNNPGGFLPTQTGTYQWVAVYSGDANNPPQASQFGDEPQKVVPPTPVTPTIVTNQGGTVVLGSGNKLSDTATLSGGNHPTGNVTFYLFAPGVTPNAMNSNAVYSEVAPLSGDTASTGTGTTTGSALPKLLGTYEWVAVYNGDANNNTVSSKYGDEGEVVASPPAISTFEGGTLHLGSGGKLYDSAQLQGGLSPTGTITFYLFAPGVTPDATDSNNIYKDVVNIDTKNPNGLYDVTMGDNPGGFLPTQTGTYQWVAVYSGDANNPPQASQFGDEPQQVVAEANTQVVVFKVPDQQQVNAGDTAGFTIKILNEGANTATGLTLSDPLPAGVASDINWQIDQSGTGFGAGTDPSDFSISGSVGHQVLTLASAVNTLAAGASISVHITGQTSLNDVDPNLPPCTTTLVNTATVNAANEPANEQNAQATSTITLHNVDVDVSKTADQTQVVAGQMAGFTIQVYNQGCIDAAGLTLNDQLPEGPGNDIFWRIDPTKGSAENFQIIGQIGSQVLEFSSRVTNLQPGELISVHIVGQTSNYDVGTLNNAVTVNASNEPSFEQNAQASASINVVQNTQNNGTALYVQAAFEQTLYRAPDDASLQAFVNALNSGAMSQTTFAMTLTHTSEYYSDIVAQAYQHFLGRTPDAQGSAYWTQQLENGLTDEQLEAQFIGSAEYYQVSGGTDKAWVDHMYFDLLGRTPDAQGENYWVQALANGASRSAVALGFAASAEREGDQVKDDYQIFLGRLPAQSEIDGWVTAFENGFTNEDVIAGFIASPEYYNRHS